MPRVSVFGATGFIGSRFCTLYPDDVCPEPRAAERPAADEILYLVSTTHNYHVHDDLQVDIDTNLKHLMRVLEACRARPVTINFVSSWFVYGPQERLPVDESACCRPRGFYAVTKKCAEDLLVSFCATFEKRYRILRLSNVYGPGDRVSPRKNGLQYMIGRLARHEPVELYDGGAQLRDYLYIDDACRALKLCMERAPLDSIVNVGTGTPARVGDLIEHCRQKLGSHSRVTSIETPAFRASVQPPDFYLDVSRLHALGFAPEVTLTEGLARVMAELAGTAA